MKPLRREVNGTVVLVADLTREQAAEVERLVAAGWTREGAVRAVTEPRLDVTVGGSGPGPDVPRLVDDPAR